MNYLWLSEKQAESIVRKALEVVPDEVCGLLAGHGQKVCKVIPISNVSDDPRRHYAMDNMELAQCLPELSDAGLDVVGFYHSHPKSEPIPSQEDIKDARWPDAIYLIVGLKANKPSLAAWRITDDCVLPVEVHVGEKRPDMVDNTLSDAEKAAIIIGAIVVFVMMVVASLILLPPAPPIH